MPPVLAALNRWSLAVLLCAAGCKAPPPPPPSPALVAALAAADEAAEQAGAFLPAAEQVTAQLHAHQQQKGVGVRQRADLEGLAREVAALAAQDDPARPPVGAAWRAVRARLDRVLQGQAPTDGPRFQVDMPDAVRSAVDEVDAAFARGDADAARAAFGKVSGAVGAWAERMPGPRAIRLMEVAERDLLQLTMLPSTTPADDLQRRWAAAKQKLTAQGD